MAKVAILKGKALINLIDKIGTTATNLQNWIHQAAVSAAFHALEHGNCTPINTLSEHCQNVTHNNAVRRWFAEYCPFVKWDTKEKAFVMNVDLRKATLDEQGKVHEKVLGEYEEKLYQAETYIQFTPPPAFQPVRVVGMLKAIVSKYEKLTDEEKADPRNKLDGIDDVKKLLAKLAA